MVKRRRASTPTMDLWLQATEALDLEIDDDAVPLKIYDPNLSPARCLRRSSRSTSNKYASADHSPSSALSLSIQKSPTMLSVRSSPRLRQHELTNSGCAVKSYSKTLMKRCFQEKDGGSMDGNLDNSVVNGNANHIKCLRRSPRHCSSGVKVELLALPPPDIKKSSKKFKNDSASGIQKDCLRSRVDMFAEAKSPLFHNQGTKRKSNDDTSPSSSDLGMLSEKSLRSRKIQFRVVVPAEKVEEDSSIVAWSNSGKTELSPGKRCLRSGVIPFAIAPHENSESKSASVQTPKKTNSDLPISSEKWLRSRKVPFRVPKNVETVSSLTKSPNLVDKWIPELNESMEVKNESPLGNKTLPRVTPNCFKSKEKSIRVSSVSAEKKKSKQKYVPSVFVGEPVPDDEAREKWSWRYELKSKSRKGQRLILNEDEEDEVILNVDRHYYQAKVDGYIISLGDCVYVKGERKKNEIGRIVEFFKTMDGEDYFRVQWFYRAEDTVIKEAAAKHDRKRIFYSTIMNDNLLDCIVSKVNVIEIAPMLADRINLIPPCDYYYDMEYSVEYSTFRTLAGSSLKICELSLAIYLDNYCQNISETPSAELFSRASYQADLSLLDLYSGCGGMSTGLCLGAGLSGVNLVTKWAIDYHKSACESLKLNHPETQVRHTTAEDFLELLKEWEKLCKTYTGDDFETTDQEDQAHQDDPLEVKMPRGVYEVLCLVDICYGDPSESGKEGLKFKVRWKGYDESEDTWEPIDELSDCQNQIREFVWSGRKSKILPLPGEVDVICGGPPCQGISGYNRYRSIGCPLDDERNQQLIVFMDIVKFLRPKYVLMENVVDILRFDKASLARYALGRLVHMNYQARLGTMAAGSYGLPQFRLRVFLWGALPTQKLPQFPLPTHDVIVRNWPPVEFEQNTVAYNEGEARDLEKDIVLHDAIADLPAVTIHETREEMMYDMPPQSEFQKYIRLSKSEMMGFVRNECENSKHCVLYDHRPYFVGEDDYLRLCRIPQKKGANFRDWPGVIVSSDNSVLRDPEQEPILLPSGKPLVPDYVFTFEKGKSKKPFARLWWDETVGTVTTFPNLHSNAALHPEQDRPLTLREYARLQGFPDFYRFCGTIKERYRQVGNAVAIPVARALGYGLGMAIKRVAGDEPVMTLPTKFASQGSPTENEIFSNFGWRLGGGPV